MMIPTRPPILLVLLVLLGLNAVWPTAAHAQVGVERVLENRVLSLRSCGWERLVAVAPVSQRDMVAATSRPVAVHGVPHFRRGDRSAPAVDDRLPVPRLQESPAGGSAASLWRGTLIGAATGFLASVAWWQIVQEEDDDSLLNGYAAAVGVVAGGLIGLGIAIVF